ncbi:hypothetical protein NDU88_011233, partial [Pleurodeles waltl]
ARQKNPPKTREPGERNGSPRVYPSSASHSMGFHNIPCTVPSASQNRKGDFSAPECTGLWEWLSLFFCVFCSLHCSLAVLLEKYR